MAVTWIADTDVAGELGLAEADAVCTRVAAAANQRCWDWRQESGYTDDVDDTSPNDAVTEGTLKYAVALYKERGGLDGIPTFDGQLPIATGNIGEVRRLLGVPRGWAV